MATLLRKKYQREKVQNIHDETGHSILAFRHSGETHQLELLIQRVS